jgi:hypothetical protein
MLVVEIFGTSNAYKEGAISSRSKKSTSLSQCSSYYIFIVDRKIGIQYSSMQLASKAGVFGNCQEVATICNCCIQARASSLLCY